MIGGTTATPFQFPILQNVLVGLNSLLARVQNSGSGSMNSSTGSRLRDSDWVNLVHLMGYPTLLVSKDQIIVAANHAFESLSGYSSSQLLGPEHIRLHFCCDHDR